MEARTPNKRAAAKAVTRQLVLHTAATHFTLHGYAATDVRTVARAAGLSTGAIFSCFESKAALYEAALGKRAPVGALQDAAPDLLEALRSAVITMDAAARATGSMALTFEVGAARTVIAKAEG